MLEVAAPFTLFEGFTFHTYHVNLWSLDVQGKQVANWVFSLQRGENYHQEQSLCLFLHIQSSGTCRGGHRV